MACKQLEGACNKEFSGDTFDEMSKVHGLETLQQQDEDHLKAMAAMQKVMQKPKAMGVWFENKRKEFEAL